MQFGLALPNFPHGASAEGIEAAAEAADRVGWSSVWTTDHVLVETANARSYGTVFEAILTLAWVGALHPRLQLGTSVVVVPVRNAVVLAKELATLDALSHGRVIAGVGAGWDEAEFRNLGVPERYRVRGAYLDETIRLWRHLWSGTREPFEGRFHPLEDYVFAPLPKQGAGLPIWVGGGSDAAVRRAGTVGDAWHSSAMAPDAYARRLPKLRAAAEAAGRPLPLLSARVRVRPGEVAGEGYAMRGTPEQIAEAVCAFAALGVTQMVLSFAPTDPDGIVAAVEQFSREVVPLL